MAGAGPIVQPLDVVPGVLDRLVEEPVGDHRPAAAAEVGGAERDGMAGLPESAKGPAFAVATGLLVYPQAAHLEHFEPRRTRQLMTGTGYIARVGRWLKESF